MKALLLATLVLSIGISGCDDGSQPPPPPSPLDPPPLWIKLLEPDTTALAQHPRVTWMYVRGKKFWFYTPPIDSGWIFTEADTVYVGMHLKRYDTSETILLTPSRFPRSRMYHEYTGVVEYPTPPEEDQ